jgi:hypothetical protein
VRFQSCATKLDAEVWLASILEHALNVRHCVSKCVVVFCMLMLSVGIGVDDSGSKVVLEVVE